MVYSPRIGPDGAFIREFSELRDRLKSIETAPAGNIVIRETLTTEDPVTGVKTTIGQLPDGSIGFQPFIGDVTPPPIASTPVVSVQPGMFTVSWDGLFVGNEAMPRDFEHVNVIGHKMNGASTVLSVTVGVLRLSSDTVLVTQDIAAIGETWQFSLESEDYNGNKAARGNRSATVTMESVVTDAGVNDALANVNNQVISAQNAAASAQTSANTAQQAADNAAQAASDAAGIAASKSKVLIQPTAPAAADQNSNVLWIDTANGLNAPKRWNGTAWIVVTDKAATDAAAAAAAAQTKADQAFNNAATAATAAGNAQTTADSKNRVWYQPDQPAGTGHKVGDTWFDTDDGYKLRTWNGSVWQTTQDSALAKQIADSKSLVYTQPTVPPIEARLATTVWYDTSLGLDKIVQKYWNGTAWTALADKTATDAAVVADSKGETIYSTTEPAVAKRLPQNLWVDTTGGINIHKRWDGFAWVVVADSRIASSATAVTAAQATADAKSVVYTQSTTPPVEARLPQTLWNDTSLGLNNIVVKYWNGTAWTALADKTATDAQTKVDQVWASARSYINPATSIAGVTTKQGIVPSTVTSVSAMGGIALRKSGTGNGWWEDSNALQAYDPTALYRFTIRIRVNTPATSGGTGFYWGLVGLASDKTTYVNATGVNTYSSQQWVIQNAKPATDGSWVDYVVYYKGISTNTPTGAGTVLDPRTVHTNTRYFVPGMILDYSSGNGVWDVSHWSVDVVDSAGHQALIDAGAKGEVIWSSTTPPAAKQLAQNLWVDTSGGLNLHKRWDGNAWVVATDSRIAQSASDITTLKSQVTSVSAQADRSITTFYGSATPTSPESGDLWLTGVAGEPMKRYDGTLWATFEDPNVQQAYAKAGDAQAAADAKVRTFAQPAAPTGMVPDDIGDLWIDTDDKNRLYRYSGSIWEELRDDTIADAQGTADTALSNASSAASAAQGAQATADGKNTSYYQPNEPTGGTYKVGDLWFDTDDNYKLRTFAGGTTWQLAQDSAGAVTTAAADATTKADAAQMAAIQAQAYQLNPSFEDWTGTIPANYTTFVTNPTKETTTVRTGKNAVRFNCTDATTQRGLQFNAALAHAPYFEYLTVELDVRLVSGTSFGGAGVLVDWVGMTGANRATISLASEIPTPTTGKWYRVVKVIRKPATATGTFTSYSAWLMGQYSTGMGTQAIKDVIFDWINVRPATAEEITAYGTPASITSLNDVLVTKTKSWFQPAQPALTGNTTGDLWFDTDDSNKVYIWNGTWAVASDQRIEALNTSVSAAQQSANGKNKVIYSTAAASGTSGYTAGDTWFQRDSVDASKIIAQWEFTTSWQSRQLNHQVVASIDAAKISVGTLDVANRIAANAISVNKLTVGDFTNLAIDGNFTDLTKKSWTGSGTVVTETNAPNKLQVVTAASGNNDQPNINAISVTGGEQFYGECWVYGEPANVGGGGPNLHMAVTTNAGTTSWPTFMSTTRAAVSGQWVKLSGSVTMPANAKIAKVEPAITYSADAVGNTYYFREVIVRRKNTGELIVDGAIKANSAIIETGAIGNAHIGDLAVGTAEIQGLAVTTAKIDDLAVNTAKISNLAVTNAKIDDLAVTNAKIANATIQAAKIGSVDAGTITVGYISANQLAATAIDGKTITGALIQTEQTASRGIKLTTTELAGYDTTGVKNFSLASNGTLTVRGAIQSGSTIDGATITGTTGIQTSATALRGVKMSNSGILAYDGSGNLTFKLDSATGIVELPGLKANSITSDKLVIGSADNIIAEPSFSNGGISWQSIGSNGISIDSTGSRKGGPSLKIVNTAVQQASYNLPMERPVEAGASFFGSMWVKADVTIPASGITLGARVILSTGAISYLVFQANSATIPANTWTRLSGTSVAPSGAMTVSFYVASQSNFSTGNLWIDYVSMVRAGTGELIVDGALDAKIITGSTVQTESTANRGIKLTSTELAGYDTAGLKNFSLTSAGALTIVGAIQSGGTISGTQVTGSLGLQTSTSATAGVKMNNTGIKAWDGSNNLTFHLDATTGYLELPGLKANSINGDRIVGGSITAAQVRVGDFSNLVTNGFGDLGGGVGIGASASFTYDSVDKPSTVAGVFKTASGQSTIAPPSIFWDVTPNTEYVTEVWLKADLPNSRIYIELKDQANAHGATNFLLTTDDDNPATPPTVVNVSHGSYVLSNLVVPTVWTKYTIRSTTTATATRLRVGNIFFNHLNGTERNAAVSFAIGTRRRVAGSLIVDGAITTAHMTSGTIDAGVLTAGSITAPKIASKSITVDKLVVSSTDNLIVEADFGNGGASWGPLNANKAIVAGIGRGALPALRVTGTTALQSIDNLVNRVTVGAEDRFRGSMYINSSVDAASGVAKLSMKAYTSATAFTSVLVATSQAVSAGVWTLVEGYSPSLPANTIAVEFFIEVQNAATGTTLDIDYVGMTRAADGKLVIDGAIDGKTITGALIQTAKTGNRVMLDSTALSALSTDGSQIVLSPTSLTAYSSTGSVYFSLSNATGTTVVGTSKAIADVTYQGVTRTIAATLGNNFRGFYGSSSTLNTVAGLGFPLVNPAANSYPAAVYTQTGNDISMSVGGATNILSIYETGAPSVSLSGNNAYIMAPFINIDSTGSYNGSTKINKIEFSPPSAGQTQGTMVAGIIHTGDLIVNGSATLKHRRAEFSNAGFAIPANSSWDIGPLTLNTASPATLNNDFCKVGPFAGSVEFTKSGYYSFTAIGVPQGNPGGAWIRAARGSDSRFLAQVSNGTAWESTITTVPFYFASGDYVRFAYFGTVAHTLKSWVTVVQDY